MIQVIDSIRYLPHFGKLAELTPEYPNFEQDEGEKIVKFFQEYLLFIFWSFIHLITLDITQHWWCADN
jgi:hypothetical protein